MSLLALSPEEIGFLSLPCASAPGTDFIARLSASLASTLRARLRLPVVLTPTSSVAQTVLAPRWGIAREFAGLWLARRLGGQAGGAVDAVPASLLRTLDAVLAERWLDAPGTLPASLAWQVRVESLQTPLALDLPASAAAMQRWAYERIAA